MDKYNRPNRQLSTPISPGILVMFLLCFFLNVSFLQSQQSKSDSVPQRLTQEETEESGAESTENGDEKKEHKNDFVKAIKSKKAKFLPGAWDNLETLAIRLGGYALKGSNPELLFKVRVPSFPDKPYLHGSLMRRFTTFQIDSVQDGEGKNLLAKDEDKRRWIEFDPAWGGHGPTAKIKVLLKQNNPFRTVKTINGSIVFRFPVDHQKQAVKPNNLPETIDVGDVKGELKPGKAKNSKYSIYTISVEEGLKNLLGVRGINQKGEMTRKSWDYFPPVTSLEFDRTLKFKKQPDAIEVYSTSGWHRVEYPFSLNIETSSLTFTTDEKGTTKRIGDAEFTLDKLSYNKKKKETNVRLSMKNADAWRVFDQSVLDAEGEPIFLRIKDISYKQKRCLFRGRGKANSVTITYLTGFGVDDRDE